MAKNNSERTHPALEFCDTDSWCTAQNAASVASTHTRAVHADSRLFYWFLKFWFIAFSFLAYECEFLLFYLSVAEQL